MAQWKSGLFGCFQDTESCLIGCIVPCYLFGQNAEQITGEEKMKACVKYGLLSCCGLQCIIHKPQRLALRTKHGLEEKPNDWLATCCCSGCANCQEAQELKHRGGGTASRVTNQPR